MSADGSNDSAHPFSTTVGSAKRRKQDDAPPGQESEQQVLSSYCPPESAVAVPFLQASQEAAAGRSDPGVGALYELVDGSKVFRAPPLTLRQRAEGALDHRTSASSDDPVPADGQEEAGR